MGYMGVSCEMMIDYCKSKPCLNGGVCTAQVNSYSCECASQYTGAQCEFKSFACDKS